MSNRLIDTPLQYNTCIVGVCLCSVQGCFKGPTTRICVVFSEILGLIVVMTHTMMEHRPYIQPLCASGPSRLFPFPSTFFTRHVTDASSCFLTLSKINIPISRKCIAFLLCAVYISSLFRWIARGFSGIPTSEFRYHLARRLLLPLRTAVSSSPVHVSNGH